MIGGGMEFMEVRCSECGNFPRKIGKEVYYCDDCDRIFTIEQRKILV